MVPKIHTGVAFPPRRATMTWALDEIAILYRQKGPLVSAIEGHLADANIPFIAEKDSAYPRTLLIQWLQDCAAFALDESGEILFESLVRYYHNLCYAAGVVDSRPNLELRTRLYDAVVAVIDSEQPLALWLREVQERIDLRETLSRAPEYVHDLEALTKMMSEVEPGGPLQDHTITDFATDAKLTGKVVVTTLHSSKGRQFDAVVLPGLVEGLVPSRRWNRRDRNYPEPTPASLSEDRRLFYVGFTRARKLVALVSAASYVNSIRVSSRTWRIKICWRNPHASWGMNEVIRVLPLSQVSRWDLNCRRSREKI